MASSSIIPSSSSPVDSQPSPVNVVLPTCIHCDSPSEPLMNGWRSRSGGYVKLCSIAHLIYEAGQYCEKFHPKEDGWRDCKSCRKLFHCGCIVSLSDYELDDFGGITCLECLNNPRDLDAPPLAVIPLFENLLTHRDVRLRNSRMEIPMMYAKAFFPQVSRGKSVPLHVLDTEGTEWHLQYHCWFYRRNIMYVLQGLKDFLKSKNRQAGDRVAFYRRELDKKIIIELKKPSSSLTLTSSHHQA